MRLTKKDITYITSGANVIEIPDIVEGHKYTGQAIIKLGQLEDIEDELGIDLITLFKALSQGVYFKNNNEIEFGTIQIVYKAIEVNRKWGFWFSNYGKTWALTREELENV